MIAITLAIGVIPESLGAVVSITLSISTKRMAKENVIVKRLSSVETLGSVNVICTDKTGTLTQNKMAIRKIIFNGQEYSANEFLKLNLDSFSEDLFNQALVLPNDAITDGQERIGDPTELALIDFAEQLGIDEIKYRQKYQRLDEIPFDSKRKLMSTLNQISDEVKVNFTKGALDELLKKCRRILIDGKVVNLTDEIKTKIMKQAAKMSNDALRVLGFAYKQVKTVKASEKDLIFLTAVGMIDPVRETAIEAVHNAHEANIRVVMITGDHPRTALAIAKELDIAYTEYEVMTSSVLESLDDEQLNRVIDNIRVFARVNPEHKTRIVQALQKKKNVTAMTGDGVNDAPSLSIADIGISMGISGTDVAKEASDVILTDDNFGTIMKGVNEGRNVYQKIKRTIVFLLGINLANVLAILVLALINQRLPLAATDIL
jgi:Ca2+-transporting ATPase